LEQVALSQEGISLSRQLFLTRFSELNLEDPFFDSLKAAYRRFPIWCARKGDEELYVVREDNHQLSGMIYLKREDGEVADIRPTLPKGRWLKVGTLKIEARGTKLGERVLKKILDTAIAEHADGIYVTIFSVHADLIDLFERYGFREHGTKTSQNTGE
jgi:acetyltransferase (GNAT) family protein